MGDVVNLKAVRKQKRREERDATAAENRIKFGLSKAKKQLAESEQARAEKALDDHKRET